MPSSLSDIRVALKGVFSQFGLQVYDTVPDVVNGPAVVVEPDPKRTADFTGAMAMGGDTYRFSVYVLVPATDVRNAQQVLDAYLTGRGTKSLRELLFNNRDLGLPDVTALAEGVDGYGPGKAAGVDMIGAIMRVCVIVD